MRLFLISALYAVAAFFIGVGTITVSQYGLAPAIVFFAITMTVYSNYASKHLEKVVAALATPPDGRQLAGGVPDAVEQRVDQRNQGPAKTAQFARQLDPLHESIKRSREAAAQSARHPPVGRRAPEPRTESSRVAGQTYRITLKRWVPERHEYMYSESRLVSDTIMLKHLAIMVDHMRRTSGLRMDVNPTFDLNNANIRAHANHEAPVTIEAALRHRIAGVQYK